MAGQKSRQIERTACSPRCPWSPWKKRTNIHKYRIYTNIQGNTQIYTNKHGNKQICIQKETFTEIKIYRANSLLALLILVEKIYRKYSTNYKLKQNKVLYNLCYIRVYHWIKGARSIAYYRGAWVVGMQRAPEGATNRTLIQAINMTMLDKFLLENFASKKMSFF